MPGTLQSHHVAGVYSWPLGKVKTDMAAGERWTDCIIELIEPIRLGGKYNTRRVRYDGRFYITHNRRRVYLDGELAWQVFEVATHVYGWNRESDLEHNIALKGY